MLLSAKTKKVSVSNNGQRSWQARRISSVLLGAGVPALMKTEQSLTNQTQIFQAFTVAVPWIWPGFCVKTGHRIQNGINRELVSQSSHVGPQSQPCHEKYNWAPSVRAGLLQWGGKSRRWRQHPAVSLWPSPLAFNGLEWETSQPSRRSGRPAASLAKWAAFPKGKLPLWWLKFNLEGFFFPAPRIKYAPHHIKVWAALERLERLRSLVLDKY